MAYLRIPLKDFQQLASFSGGDKLTITLKGSVALKMLGNGEDFVTLDVSELNGEKEVIREHPSEIMMRMAEMQGLINTPVP